MEKEVPPNNENTFIFMKGKLQKENDKGEIVELEDKDIPPELKNEKDKFNGQANEQFNQIIVQLCATYQFLSNNCENTIAQTVAFDSLLIRMDMLSKSIGVKNTTEASLLNLPILLKNDFQLQCNASRNSYIKQYYSMIMCQKTLQLAIMKTKENILKSAEKKSENMKQNADDLITLIEDEYRERAEDLVNKLDGVITKDNATQLIIQDDISLMEEQLLFVLNNAKDWSKDSIIEVCNKSLFNGLIEKLIATEDNAERTELLIEYAINRVDLFAIVDGVSEETIKEVKEEVEEKVKEEVEKMHVDGGQSGGGLSPQQALILFLVLAQLLSRTVAQHGNRAVALTKLPRSTQSDAFKENNQVSLRSTNSGIMGTQLITLEKPEEKISYHTTSVKSLTDDLEKKFFYVALGTAVGALGTAAAAMADKKAASDKGKVVVFEIIDHMPTEPSTFFTTIFNFGEEKKYAVPRFTVEEDNNGEITVVDGAPGDDGVIVPTKIDEQESPPMENEEFVKKYLFNYVKQLKSIDPNTVEGVDPAAAAFEQLKKNELLTILEPETRGKIMGDAIIKLHNKGIEITQIQKIELVKSLGILNKNDVNEYSADAVLGLSIIGLIKDHGQRANLIAYARKNKISNEAFIKPITEESILSYQLFLVTKTLQQENIKLITNIEELRKYKKKQVLEAFIEDLVLTKTIKIEFLTKAIADNTITLLQLREQYEKYLDNPESESLNEAQKAVYQQLEKILAQTTDELLTERYVSFTKIQKEGIENMNKIQKKMVQYLNLMLNPNDRTTMTTVQEGWIWNTEIIEELRNNEMIKTAKDVWKVKKDSLAAAYTEQQIAGPEESNMLDAPDDSRGEYEEKVVAMTIPTDTAPTDTAPTNMFRSMETMLNYNKKVIPNILHSTNGDNIIMEFVHYEGYYLQKDILTNIKELIVAKKLDIRASFAQTGLNAELLDNPDMEPVEAGAQKLSSHVLTTVKTLSDTYLLLTHFGQILDAALTVMERFVEIPELALDVNTNELNVNTNELHIGAESMVKSTENYEDAYSELNTLVEGILGEDVERGTDIRTLVKKISNTLSENKAAQVQLKKKNMLNTMQKILEHTTDMNKMQKALVKEESKGVWGKKFASLDGILEAAAESTLGQVAIGAGFVLLIVGAGAVIAYSSQLLAAGKYILKIVVPPGVGSVVYYVIVYYANPSITNWALPLAIGSGGATFLWMTDLLPSIPSMRKGEPVTSNATAITTVSPSSNNQLPPAITASSNVSGNQDSSSASIASGNTGASSGDAQDQVPWSPPPSTNISTSKYEIMNNFVPKGGKKQSRKIKKQNKSKKTTIRKRSRKMRRGVKTRQRRGNKSKTRKRYNSYKRKSKK